MSQENKRQKLPTYQVNIPATVRFDRRLSAHTKLLNGEIKALCDKKGYCWASNRYLSWLYGVDRKVISRWIQQLEKHKHIQVEVVQSRGNVRKIFLLDYHFKSGNCPQKSETSPPTQREVSTLNKGGMDAKIDSCLPKNEVQSPLLLIDNIIDYNDRVYRSNIVSTKKGIGKKYDEFGEEKKEEVGNCSGGNIPSPPVAAAPPSPKSSNELSSKPQKPAFIKPNLQQVEEYMLSQKDLCPDASLARGQAPRFVNYYESNGWKVGRNPMQDWQAAANNWLLNAKQYQSGNSGKSGQSSNYSKPRPNAYLFTERDKDYGIPF